MKNIEIYTAQFIEMVIRYGTKLVLSLLVLMIGLSVIKKISNIILKLLTKRKVDPTLIPFLTNLVSWTLKVLLVISVASMVGIETTSFVAVIGAAGLAIGLALQGSLANFAGGVLILIFRPFLKGDYIEAQGHEGIVETVDIFATSITTNDNRKVILPNGPLAGGSIKNYSANSTRRVDLSIGIGYNDDIRTACKVLSDMCYNHPKILKEPNVFVGVKSYGDSSINLVIRPWCLTQDYWNVYYELNETIKYTLDQNKISIPFPQRDVHVFNQKL